MDAHEQNDVIAFARRESAEAAELRLKVKHLERRLRHAESRLETIYSSWTWRVGRVVLFPVALLRWARSKFGA
jgi:hypothetical protein